MKQGHLVSYLIKDGIHGIPVPDNVDENVSTKVVHTIQSYVGIVNKIIWKKGLKSEFLVLLDLII